MDASKPRLMLVAHDTALKAAYRARATADGFDIHVCNDGHLALTQALVYRPHIVVLDAIMPSLSVYDVIELLHTSRQTAAAAIIILSNFITPADRHRAGQLNAHLLARSTATIDRCMAIARRHISRLLNT